MTATLSRRGRRGRRGRRALTLLATLLVTLVIGSVALVAIGRMTGQFDVAVVLSGSMEPAMRPADVVVLVDRAPDKVAVGDVLAFVPPRRMNAATTSTLTLHRVIEINRDGDVPMARTQGDANASVDPWGVPLDGSAEVAEVTRRVPLIGHAVLGAQGRTGRIALYIAAVLLLAGPVFGWVRRQWRGEQPSSGDSSPAADGGSPHATPRTRTSDETLFAATAAAGGAGAGSRDHDHHAVDTRSMYGAPQPPPHDR